MKAILFDLDGTLIDSTTAIVNGFNEAFKAYNMPLPNKQELCSLIGYPLEIMFCSLGAPKEEVANFIQIYKNDYQKNYLDNTFLLDGVKDCLQFASKNAKLAVVTTKTSKYSKILLEHLGILQNFSAVIGRDDVINPKPHPEPILKALNALNIKDSLAFMVGDTPLDAKAAKKANIKAIGVLCGYAKRSDLQNFCDEIFNSTPLAVEYIIKNF